MKMLHSSSIKKEYKKIWGSNNFASFTDLLTGGHGPDCRVVVANYVRM